MDGLTTRKLFVDSRLRQPGGESHDFVIELPETIEFPPGTHVLCSEALIPTSFNTVDDRSNRLYLGENAAGAASFRYIELGPQPHDSESLRLALQNALNANRPAGLGTYTVTRSSSAGATSTAAIGSAAYRYFTVTLSSGAFLVFPRQTLANKSWYENVWLANGGPTYDPKDLRIWRSSASTVRPSRAATRAATSTCGGATRCSSAAVSNCGGATRCSSAAVS